MATQNTGSALESLPQELLGEILAKVATSSVEDISHCLTVSSTISAAVQDDHVIKHLNLRRQSMHPLVAVHRYHHLMEKCIKSEHPAAHYIEGIKQFFIYDNRALGLTHLKRSGQSSYDNATLLYGVLLLCISEIEEGKSVLRTLGWESSRCRTNRAWRDVKRSLRYVFIIMKPEYTAALRNNQPPLSCHKNDKDNLCPQCFHYKMMRKFIGFIRQNN